MNPQTKSTDLKATLQEAGVEVPTSTIQLLFEQNGLYGRVARKKPLILGRHKNVPLEYARNHIDESEIFWYKVIWSDVTYIILYTELFGHSHHRYVWKQVTQEFQEMNTIATVKHGSGSLMLLGCISANCTGKLINIEGKLSVAGYQELFEKKPAGLGTKVKDGKKLDAAAGQKY